MDLVNLWSIAHFFVWFFVGSFLFQSFFLFFIISFAWESLELVIPYDFGDESWENKGMDVLINIVGFVLGIIFHSFLLLRCEKGSTEYKIFLPLEKETEL